MPRKIRINQHSLLFLVLLLLTSCDSHLVFDKYERVPDASWKINAPVHFEVNITDTLSAHNLYIGIRNKGSYAYNNLFLFITTTSPTGSTVRDTVEITLAGPEGKWKGRGFGDLFTLRTMWKKNVRFPYTGIYSFDLVQAMRNDPLKGITDVGIRIDKIR